MASVFGAAGVKYNKTDVTKFGSTRWIARTVSDTDGTSTDEWAAGPWKMDLKLTPADTKTEREGSDGEKITVDTITNYAMEVTVGQRDKGSVLGFMRSARGKTVQFIFELTPNQVGSANVRQYLMALGKPAGEPEIGEKSDPIFKFDLVKATDDIDEDLASLTMYSGADTGFGATTGTVSLPSGEFFDITEL